MKKSLTCKKCAPRDAEYTEYQNAYIILYNIYEAYYKYGQR